MRKIDRNVVTWLGFKDENNFVQMSEDLTMRIWDVRALPFKPSIECKIGTNFATHADIIDVDGKSLLVTGHRGFNNEGAEVKLWDLSTL
jgi:hypothetical protein